MLLHRFCNSPTRLVLLLSPLTDEETEAMEDKITEPEITLCNLTAKADIHQHLIFDKTNLN